MACRGLDGGIQIIMETSLTSIATKVLQPPEELGEVQPYGITGTMETKITG